MLEEATDVPVWRMRSGVEGQGQLGGRCLNVHVVVRGCEGTSGGELDQPEVSSGMMER